MNEDSGQIVVITMEEKNKYGSQIVIIAEAWMQWCDSDAIVENVNQIEDDFAACVTITSLRSMAQWVITATD